MFLIKTYVGNSPIEGIGVFADEDWPEGKVIWREQPDFDQVYTADQIRALPKEARWFMEKFTYVYKGLYHFNCDHARFTNHDDNPNTRTIDNGDCVTTRPIKKGDEITISYADFEQDWPDNPFE